MLGYNPLSSAPISDPAIFIASATSSNGQTTNGVAILDLRPLAGDAPREDNVGWDRNLSKKRKKDDKLLEETIRNTYNNIFGITPSKEIVAEVKQELNIPYLVPLEADNQGNSFNSWLLSQISVIEQLIDHLHQQHIQDEEDIEILLMAA